MISSPRRIVPTTGLVASDAQLQQLRSALASCERERDEYRKLFEASQQEIERLRRHLFGPRREKVDPAQTQLAFASISEMLAGLLGSEPDAHPESNGPALEPEPEPRPRERTRDDPPHARGRRALPEHLPVERIELPGPLVDAQWTRIGEEITETLEWRPASFVRVHWVRGKFARRGDASQGIRIAPLPARVIDKGVAGPGLLAHVLVSKHADHLPLHRQSAIFARQGIPLARSTLGGWVEGAASALRPLVEAMWRRALVTNPFIAIDATGVLVQAPERCRRGFFWVTVAGREAFFHFTPKQNGATPRALLPGYRGVVLADASAVYHALYRETGATEAGCWAHCRRGFFEALSTDPERAAIPLGLIARLYEVDRATREMPLNDRTLVRGSRASPILHALRSWLETQQLEVLPRSPLGQAITYARNQWEALTRFVGDGRLPLDNNVSERELRRIAVGRKNWLFVGSEEGAEWAATTVSLIASCAMAGIEPWAYLRDVLTVLPTWPAARILELAPQAWQQTRQKLNAEQLAGRVSCHLAREPDAPS